MKKRLTISNNIAINMKQIILFLFLSPLFGYAQIGCNNLPLNYSTYNKALSSVKGAKFSYVDNINTSRSSFITIASYYSCDGRSGFLIIGLQNREYIHKNLPKTIWMQLKQASSLGTFYNQYIRGRYTLVLKN